MKQQWITLYYSIPIIISMLNCAQSFLPPLPGYMYNEIPYRYTRDSQENTETFDFIIVGSGSSGSVLANRLSEISNWKVLLLEAGNAANEMNKIPLFAPAFAATGYNWNYTTERQEGICEGLVNEVCPWPRGKALGGSTILNYMIYTRGNPEDYKRWSEQNEGWSYNEVLRYYKKSEECRLESATCSDGFHSSRGYLSVERPYSSVLTDAFIEAGIQMGSKQVDYNSIDFMGFSKMQANLKFGRRHSVADAFLLPVENRKNLKVLTAARVLKLLIDPTTKEAYGVEFIKRGKIFQVRAEKEVILSAGAFNSPQLLLLSGIGPTKHLQDIGIQPIVDLPVGQNMYDHLSYIGLAFKINQTIQPSVLTVQPAAILDYLFNGKGFLTSLGGTEALAYIKTSMSKEPRNYPDVELIFSGIGSLQSDYGVVSVPTLGIKREIYEKVYKPIENTPCWSILPMLLHPKSKGYLKLRSKNPFDSPLLYPNFFTDPEDQDLKTMIAAIRFIIDLSKTPAFQKFGTELHDIPLPGCEQHPFNSDSYWECCLRLIAVTLHHQIGTCKMGRREDPEAVVDNRCRVHGVKRLRVVDTSVIPVTLSAHTSAPAMMMGERVSDMIKEDHNMLEF
ncbi:glucose dehydrogenase [FAD, quinone]-like [Harmonia axyridis]|uniref:glucose dehydrogenase [FAD, quinone]-like n=1 Tax=Harmonia axyridis TaxID=115357 RepID=UPI001E276F2B|nr:glucose dehydrogenase [FAD, quinone]-like [Harmonia axyridis]XP_045465784.1 glucose dehydrogenase [FAD, quinone]-like [Harmonia axyridis]